MRCAQPNKCRKDRGRMACNLAPADESVGACMSMLIGRMSISLKLSETYLHFWWARQGSNL